MQIVKIIAITSPNCNSRTVHLAVHVMPKSLSTIGVMDTRQATTLKKKLRGTGSMMNLIEEQTLILVLISKLRTICSIC